MRKTFFLWLTCVALTNGVAAADVDLSKDLTDRYHSKMLVLRHPVMADSQHYDVDGKPLFASDDGPWTVYGRIFVTEIVAGPKELRVEGYRAIYQLDEQRRLLVPRSDHHTVVIAIGLNSPLSSMDDALGILERVFAMSLNDVVNTAPPYWRTYLKRILVPLEKGQALDPGTKQEAGDSSPNDNPGDRPVDMTQPGLRPAKPIFTPEPEFTAAARKLNYQGLVRLDVLIDKLGRVSDVQIVTPLGLGLDENAVKVVKTWRFSPAKLNGEPRLFRMNVDIDFHL
jgi:TonB family protein